MSTLECLGAAGEVTGSAYLLTGADGGQILIDKGVVQGQEKKKTDNHHELDFDPKSIKAVILTHAHLDHSGEIPRLIKNGYKGDIFMTQPTADLTTLILKDQIRVLQQRGETPFYSPGDLIQTLRQIKTVLYDQPFTAGDFTVTLRDAHHILGSASVELIENSSHRPKIVFSGDIGNGSRPNIKDADIVIMESTYGDRNHPSDDPRDVINNEIHQIEKQKKGALLIPAFSIDRTQGILRIIRELKKSGKIDKKTPVFLDSPMGLGATYIYERHLNGFLKDTDGGQYKHPFSFDGLVTTDYAEANEGKSKHHRAKVIIAGSGMMEGGRIRDKAKKYLPDEYSRILFVGYLAEGTLGRKILEGAKEVQIDDWLVSVNASVNATGSLSSHADQNGLIDWLNCLNHDHGHARGARQVYLVHGGESQRQTLADRIDGEFGIDVTLPRRHQLITL
jgi:metallo-beta-lactamase family protein